MALSQETVDVLRGYYEIAPLELPENAKFHQFRVELVNHHFRILRGSIRSVEDLRKQLVHLAPLNVWESANMFLNQSSVGFNDYCGKRAGWQWASNIMLGDGNLVFDCDFHDRGFEDVRTDALKILDYLHEQGYREDRVTATGRGFQILCLRHDLHLPRVSPKARFNLYREKRKPILDELEKRGIKCDREITLDPKRIMRTVGSINWKAQTVCATVKNLDSFTYCDAERVRLQGIPQATVNVGGMTSFLLTEKIGADPNLRTGVPTRIESEKPELPTPAIYLSSIVLGTLDRQVVLLSFKKPVDLEKLKIVLSRFAEREQLAPFVLFNAKKDSDNVYALSPSAVQNAGMKRLLKRFSRDNDVYQKFKRRIVPLPIEYVDQSSGVTDTEKPISKAHYVYLNHYGLAEYPPRVLCGNDLLSTPIGEMKT